MRHPAQRICCNTHHLFYAIGQVIYVYDMATTKSRTLWTAGPITAPESRRNIDSRRVLDLVVHGEHLVWHGEDKVLRVLDWRRATMLSERELVKRGCALAVDDEIILVGDKFGDVYHYPLHDDTPRLEEEAVPILGHVSMLTALALTRPDAQGGRSVVSADRDEHIRISEFPKGYIVQHYCLAHTQFVSALLILEATTTTTTTQQRLVSAGGDAFLCFWDLESGALVRKIVMTEAVALAKTGSVGFAVVKLLEIPHHAQIAVLVEDVRKVFLYASDGERDQVVRVIDLALPAVDMALASDNTLFVTYDTTQSDDDVHHFACFELLDATVQQLPIAGLNDGTRKRVVEDGPEYTTHKLDVMRKRTKTELAAIRDASREANKRANAPASDRDDNVDPALQRAIEADRAATAKLTERVAAP